jgi:hypothetical protein
MVKKSGGDMVKAGFYWNAKEWDAKIAPPEGCVLPGDASVTYYRLPLLALLVIAPLMGAVYAFFLPFIGFAMLTMFLAGRVRGMLRTTPPAAGQTDAEHTRKAA